MADFPSKAEIVEWVQQNPDKASKRDIARAFGLKGTARIALKDVLDDLEADGEIERKRRKVRPKGALPPVGVIEISSVDSDGDLWAKGAEEGTKTDVRIRLVTRRNDPVFGVGDRVLAKLRPGDAGTYEARPIKKLQRAAQTTVGILRVGPHSARLEPVDKRSLKEWIIPKSDLAGASDGDLVEVEALPSQRNGLPRGQVITVHGDPTAPGQVSLIAMVQHEIPLGFDAETMAEADRAKPVVLGKREDLRELPLITIDPPDARDHDDAVCAAPDSDPKNPNGHVVWVAIADVAHYVRPNSSLDREARERGNSTYFPDRVSPMLPETLSADLCSLHEDVDRPCMAVEMIFDQHGDKLRHRFTRGLMRSKASLDYARVQAAIDGEPTDIDTNVVDQILKPLYEAYAAVSLSRARRAPLDLDLPERRIEISEDGTVSGIGYRDRLDAHRLIEEFMILANVCAAETLENSKTPLLYRVHEEPNPEKMEALRTALEEAGIPLAKGQVLKTEHFNKILATARGTDAAETVAMSVLRAQTQAYYGAENLSHFGLNLKRYAHFTSPIRRYADLLVHRALVSAGSLGGDGLTSTDIERLSSTAEHISRTERRSMEAGRDTNDRYVAAFLSDRAGGSFDGVVSGVSRAGAFVRLTETGADGLIPISTLGTDYFNVDRARNMLIGERTHRAIGLGMSVTVRLVEATPVTGGLILELLSVEGSELNADSLRGKGRRGKYNKGRFQRKGGRRSRK